MTMDDQEPERRDTTERRGRPRGGRRASDPILDLRTHAAAFVTVDQLADYWRYHQNTIIKWIKNGRLAAMQGDREYRIRTSDALALERELFKRPA